MSLTVDNLQITVFIGCEFSGSDASSALLGSVACVHCSVILYTALYVTRPLLYP